jgi:outer membrane receptor protein involved in Fe transport
VVASVVWSIAWATGPKIPFNIPAGEFSRAIIEFSKQSQLEILYASIDSVADIRTHAVVGELDVSAALTRMLEGTGFTFEFENDRSVLLKREVIANSVELKSAESVLREGRYRGAATAPSSAQVNLEVEEVVVTGSYLHGLREIVSPLVVLGRKEQRYAAYGTVQDVLRTLPFNYGGAPSEEYSVNQNFNRGSGVNLHGLGSGATLVLVNGFRQPVSGIDGDFVDISTVPLSAVDRIEVLPDGSSALYGSDAIAGVVNIILRKNLSGGETMARAGTALGGGNEIKVSQLLGDQWSRGEWLFAYQYEERSALAGAERDYAASADKRPFGGTDQRSTSGSPGNILDPGTMQPLFAIPRGQDGRALTAAELLPNQVNFQDQIKWRDLLPDRVAHSAYLSASQRLGDHLELFGEARYNQRRIAAVERPYEQLLWVPATNPFFVDPFGNAPGVLVAYNFSREFGPIEDTGVTETYTGAAGLKADITDQWHATLSGFHGAESMHWEGRNLVDFDVLDDKLASTDRNTAFNPFGDGTGNSDATLAAIRRIQREEAVSNIDTVNLVVDGTLPDFFSLTPRLALGLDSRRESLRRIDDARYDRRISAAFGEVSIPLATRLDFSLAARAEKYSDFGSTYNPKVGLHWTVNQSFRFRGTWGTSFRAPSLIDLYDHSQDRVLLAPIADARSLIGYTTALIRVGSNPDLQEETASTWTVGIDVAPLSIPGLKFSSTYYEIDNRDQTWHYRPNITLDSMLAEDQWAPLVTWNPSQQQINALCASPLFLHSTGSCLATAPGVILDIRARNLSTTKVDGIDFELRQTLQTKHGNFNVGFTGSYLLGFEQALTRAAPSVDLTGTQGNPPKLRLRSVGEWYQHGQEQPGFGGSIAVDYLDGSRDRENPTVRSVPAWVTFDAQLNYRTSKIDAWPGDVELTLNAVNVFDSDPPFVNRLEGYDPVNAKPYGRVVSLEVQKNW